MNFYVLSFYYASAFRAREALNAVARFYRVTYNDQAKGFVRERRTLYVLLSCRALASRA